MDSIKDVFICHAREDKQMVAKPLIDALKLADVSFWFDEAEIKWGDSITQKVNEGLSMSQYVIVILSPAFISKNWPQRELYSVLNIEASFGEVKVLPLLVGTDEERRNIFQKLPLLNDKLYLTWENNARDIIDHLLSRLSKDKSPEIEVVAVPIPSLPANGKIKPIAVKPPDWLRYKLVAFDLDGTILRGYKFSWTLVWKYLGYSDGLQRTGMRRYLTSKMSYKQWCDWACQLFIDKDLKKDDFKKITEKVSLTRNFHTTLKKLKKEGLILALISGGMDTFMYEKIPDADELFDYIFINRLVFDEHNRLKEINTTEYDFAGKANAIKLICEANGIETAESIFIGEGFNDEDAATIAGLSIAYPPISDGLEVIADVKITEDDLSLILPHVLAR